MLSKGVVPRARLQRLTISSFPCVRSSLSHRKLSLLSFCLRIRELGSVISFPPPPSDTVLVASVCKSCVLQDLTFLDTTRSRWKLLLLCLTWKTSIWSHEVLIILSSSNLIFAKLTIEFNEGVRVDFAKEQYVAPWRWSSNFESWQGRRVVDICKWLTSVFFNIDHPDNRNRYKSPRRWHTDINEERIDSENAKNMTLRLNQ